MVGSGYTYLQEYVAHAAQAAIRTGMIDIVGLGRMVLSYPELPADALAGKTLTRNWICRTLSDCTTAPRNGLRSGCHRMAFMESRRVDYDDRHLMRYLPPMTMRYAICNETYVDWPFAKACDHAAACGYTGLEIAPFTLGSQSTKVSATQRVDLRRTIEGAGLECVGLHWLLAKTTGFHVTHADPAVRQQTVDYLGDLARLAADLGGRVLVFGSPQQRSLMSGVSPAEALDHLFEVFFKLLPVLEQTNTVVALEPLAPSETNVLTTAAETCRLIERIGSPHVRLHLDVKAMSSEPTPIPEIIRASAKHLEHFHANDANLQGPGFGAVDFVPIFKALEEVRYGGWVSVEVFDYAPGVERLAKESIEYMKRVAGPHE